MILVLDSSPGVGMVLGRGDAVFVTLDAELESTGEKQSVRTL